jgi:thiamine pyrophosphate-dependent acetolactate synthase large subunit-like protein
MAQALVRFLSAQHTERDGRRQRFIAGMFGIFGHGNVAGVGQALDQMRDRIPYHQCRNEQAMVHTAAAFAKMSNRLRTLACTTSIGPGATNMVTGAAGATINRLPVLLLPGDLFANRAPAPVLQQLETAHTQDISVNDCFKPVSRYWDRISRPEQLVAALPEAMRVLTSPSETGAVTLSLPEDTQTEAWDYPEQLFEERVWTIGRPRGDRETLQRAAAIIRASRRPLVIAGGGVLYSEATQALRRFAEATGIAVCETQAGKSAIAWDHPHSVGALGVTGSVAANQLAREADVVVAVGTRLGDFATMSKSAFQDPDVRFVSINICELDAFKHAAVPVVADARVALEELATLLEGFHVAPEYAECISARAKTWRDEVDRLLAQRSALPFAQAEVIGIVNAAARSRDVVRSWEPSGRSPQAVACDRAQHLPPRIRLLLYGLRNRWRSRRQDGRSVARRVRHGRRRILPDDGAGDRDLRPGRLQAHDRARRQRRLCQHRRVVSIDRIRRFRYAISAIASRSCGQRGVAGSHCASAGRSRRHRARSCRSGGSGPHDSRVCTGRSAEVRARVRILVGRSGCRRLGAGVGPRGSTELGSRARAATVLPLAE